MEITTYTGTGTDTATKTDEALTHQEPGEGRRTSHGPDSGTLDLMRIDRRFGTVVREGPWIVSRRIEVRLTAGNVRLDFTEAVIDVDTVHLDVDLGLGSELTLVVQPGIKVVAEDLDARLGDFDLRAQSDGATPTFLRVEVSGRLHGGGDLVVRRPRRNFDQWMRPNRAS
ncbi:hypothetical protein [Rugosimonospora acidiphila]